MISKKNHPPIKVHDWIKVEGADCLVTQIYQGWSLSGVCEVVTNRDLPINKDVCWNGNDWVFCDKPRLVNAAKTPRLMAFTKRLLEA